MGTRGSYGVRIDEKDKLTYNHFDSYPSSLGSEICEQIKQILKTHSLDDVKTMARNLRIIDSETAPTKEEIAKLKKYADRGVSSGKLDEWYVLLRNMQGDLFASLTEGVILEGNEFIHDSLFCEYAYIANFDTGKLEFYKGFNQAPGGAGRYAEKKSKNQEYYGCTLVTEFDLTNLPDDFVDQCEKLTQDPDEEENED